MIPCQRQIFDVPRDIAYFNCAYMSPLMTPALEAGEAGLRLKTRPWTFTIQQFFDPLERARALFAEIAGCDADGVAITPSASYGIETAARNLPIARGESIVVLADQFPSNVYPWRRAAAEAGGEIVAAAPPPGEEATGAVLAVIEPRTAVVALPHVLWTTGQRIDLAAVRARADEVGAALVLDLTQSAGAMEIDFAEVRPDFAAVATYKWMLGPYALGFLYAAPDRRDGAPLEEGWASRAGAEQFSRLVDYREAYQPGARRYDMGERANFAAIPAAAAAMEQILAWGVGRIEATIGAMNAALGAELEALGLAPMPAAARGPHFLGVPLPADAPPDLVARLAAEGIHVSERAGALRVTPHLWCDEEDAARLVAALARHLGRAS